jgi:hypothetical protein
MPALNTRPPSRANAHEHEHRVLPALAEADDADVFRAALRSEVAAGRENVLGLLPAEGLLPRGIAEAGVVLEAEVALIGGENVVAVRVQHRGPTDHRRVAVRVEAVDDDHAGRVAAVQRKLAAAALRRRTSTEPDGTTRAAGASGLPGIEPLV